MKKLIIAVLLVMGILCNICTAEEKIITATADPYPPFIDPSDSREGLSLAIIRAAYQTQGYTVKMEFMPWARAIKLVIAGKYDIIPDIWTSEENKKTMLLSDPYVVNKIKFVVNANDPFEYNGIESLKGKKVGIVKAYTYSAELYASKDFIRKEAPDQMVNIKNLVIGRIDITLEDEIVMRSIIQKADASYLPKIRFTQNSFSENPLHISSGLANPKCQELITAFNKGLAEIKSNGEFNKIFISYGLTN